MAEWLRRLTRNQIPSGSVGSNPADCAFLLGTAGSVSSIRDRMIEFYPQWSSAVVAEWLRRLTRNQIPSGSVGSNPADCAFLLGTAVWNPSVSSIQDRMVEFYQQWSSAVVAEWLRRLTRNQIPSGSVGSNPADCGIFLATAANFFGEPVGPLVFFLGS